MKKVVGVTRFRAHVPTWALLSCAAGVVLAPGSLALAQDPETSLLAAVRLTTERALVAGCGRLGMVSDDSVKDLRRKIVRRGGNTGLLSFPRSDLSRIHAEVLLCTASAPPRPPAPPAPGAPPGVPLPPPGPPPPPPPDGRR